MASHVALDRLEQRRLLAATAILHNGLLTVRGDATAANTINVAFSSNQSNVDVTIRSVDAKGKATNFSQTFAASGVHSLAVLGSSKADSIIVGQSGPSFNIATFVNGGSGNDTITTGAENDIINAGGGYDSITSGDGNDSVNGSIGNDTVYAGNGNDVVVAGPGNNYIHAGNGNDTLFGGSGDDSLIAGNGTDQLWGSKGNDFLSVGSGNDTLSAGGAANTLLGGSGHDTFIVVKSLLINPNNNYSASKDTLKIVSAHAKVAPPLPKI